MAEMKLLIACLLVTTVAAFDPGDTKRCSREETVRRGWIIDIKSSMLKGADLLDGVFKDNLSECISECCTKANCDMVLYKNEGLSESGKNCYFVRCGALDTCVLVEHTGFTSVLLEKDSAADKTPEDGSPMEPETPPSTTPTTASARQPPSTPPQNSSGDSSSDDDDKQDTSPQDTVDDDSTKEEEDSSNNQDNHGGNTEPDNSQAIENAQVDHHDDKAIDGIERIHSNDSPNENCGKYGCDGSGVIAVSVVGSICFAIIVVVIAVVLKRVVDVKKKRRFNNVDYLINGMYT